MVISYQDMVQKTTPVTNENVWEVLIDKAIQEQFTFEKRIITLILKNDGPEISGYTIEKLKRMYSNAGWNIVITPPTIDQRHGEIDGRIVLTQGAVYRSGERGIQTNL